VYYAYNNNIEKGQDMEQYAIETETHSERTLTHFVVYGKQLEGKQGAWTSMCGRIVRGTVWQAGTVEGGRCKQCATKQVWWQNFEDQRTQRQQRSAS
jgi:hypothetical protein